MEAWIWVSLLLSILLSLWGWSSPFGDNTPLLQKPAHLWVTEGWRVGHEAG